MAFQQHLLHSTLLPILAGHQTKGRNHLMYMRYNYYVASNLNGLDDGGLKESDPPTSKTWRDQIH